MPLVSIPFSLVLHPPRGTRNRQHARLSRLGERGRARIVTKRVSLGEFAYFCRKLTPDELPRNAGSETSWRLAFSAFATGDSVRPAGLPALSGSRESDRVASGTSKVTLAPRK